MKKLLFSLLLSGAIMPTFAQHTALPTPHKKAPSLTEILKSSNTSRSQNKTTAVLWRLIGTSTYADQGGGLAVEDSAQYIYSNSRGSSMDESEWMYDDYGTENLILCDTALNYYDNGSGIELDERYTSKYDNSNRRTQYMGEINDGTQMVKDEDNYMVYDANGNLIKETSLYWDSNTQSWDSSTTYYTTYNAQNKAILDSSYNHFSSMPSIRTRHTYDANGNRTSSFSETYNGTSWDSMSRETITYYSNNKPKVSVFEYYRNNKWYNSTKDSLGYGTAPFYTYSLYQEWDTTAKKWENYVRETRTVNSNNQLDAATTSSWNDNTSSWEKSYDLEWSYDSNNNPTQGLAYAYIGGMRINSPVAELNYYYGYYFPASINNISSKQSINIYPNPATENFNVILSASSTVTMYDFSGRAVYNTVAPSGTLTVPVNNLPSGMYMLSVREENGATHTAKVSIQ